MKKMLIYGDSLSTGTHGDGAYLDKLRKKLEIEKIENYSVGSSGLSLATPNSMMEVLDQHNDLQGVDADIIFVWHGTNDWYWGTEIGNKEDTSKTTFYGAVYHAMGELRRRNPEALIVWATPIFRWEAPDGVEERGDAAKLKNKVGNTQLAYTEALRNAADLYHFPLIEMGRLVDIHKDNADRYLEDKVHPNVLGYRKIERILVDHLKQYYAWHNGEK